MEYTTNNHLETTTKERNGTKGTHEPLFLLLYLKCSITLSLNFWRYKIETYGHLVSAGQILSRIGYFTSSQIVLLNNTIIWMRNMEFYWKGAAHQSQRHLEQQFSSNIFLLLERKFLATTVLLSIVAFILYCQWTSAFILAQNVN